MAPAATAGFLAIRITDVMAIPRVMAIMELVMHVVASSSLPASYNAAQEAQNAHAHANMVVIAGRGGFTPIWPLMALHANETHERLELLLPDSRNTREIIC